MASSLKAMSGEDTLVDRVYARVIDLAKHKFVFYNPQTSQYELEPVHYTLNDQHDAPFELNEYLKYQSNYNVLEHTCLSCIRTFDSAKNLLKHFIIVHIGQVPTYKCQFNGCGTKTLLELDLYLKHISDEHLKDLSSFFTHFYDIFILKYMQDIVAQYMMLGRFYIDRGLVNRLNKLQFGRENTTLSEKILIRVYENMFQAAMPAKLTLKSSSFKSNLLFNTVTQLELLNEIKAYLNLDIEVTASFDKYLQCKICMKLFGTFNDAQVHFANFHTYNTQANKLVSCPYCNQIVKSNTLDANVLSLLNKHISCVDGQVTECTAIKTQSMNLFNSFLVSDGINHVKNDFLIGREVVDGQEATEEKECFDTANQVNESVIKIDGF